VCLLQPGPEHAIVILIIQAPRRVNRPLFVNATIPVGNRTPKLSVMKNMCVHNMLSTGSNVMAWPSGNSSSWCSCEATNAIKRDRMGKRYKGRETIELFEDIIEDVKGEDGEDGGCGGWS
jgi:hypothetical protein